MPDDTIFCGECGTALPATARFCATCGTRQEHLPAPSDTDDESTLPPTAPPAAAPPPHRQREGEHAQVSPGPEEPLRERVDHVVPGASELADQLLTRLNTPGVVSAGIVGLVAFAASLAAGILIGLATPSGSFLRQLMGGDDLGSFARVLVSTVGVAGGHTAEHVIAPVLFFAVPIAAGFFGARSVASRLTGLTDRARILWSMGGAVVFAVLMMIVALVANGQGDAVDIGIGSVLLGSVVTSLLGIVPGALLGARAASPERPVQVVPERALTWLRLIVPALKALAAVYAVALLVTVIVWGVQSVRNQPTAIAVNGTSFVASDNTAASSSDDSDDSDDAFNGSLVFRPRSVAGALVENLVFSPSYAVSVTATTLLAQDETGGPVLPGSLERQVAAATSEKDLTSKGGIFALNHYFPVYVFLPIVILLLGTMVLAGLYAGFATARRAGATTPGLGAAFGALTGPVWALAMVFLRELSGWASVDGGSMFLWTLVLGAALGALGGFLAPGALAPQPQGEPARA